MTPQGPVIMAPMIRAANKLSTYLSDKVNRSIWIKDVRSALSTRHCLLCLASHRDPLGICPPCQADLPWLRRGCERCGLPLPNPTDAHICAACAGSAAPPFDRCEGLFHYEFPIRELISAFKFQGQLWHARPLGGMLAERVAQWDAGRRPDLILPTPLHPRRLRERGFNQAQELARVVSRRLGSPMNPRALIKVRATAAQSQLSKREREDNLRNAFKVMAQLDGCRILLIDDIVTTGQTATEISRALRDAGAGRIEVLCIARTSPGNSTGSAPPERA